jgi:hypothetical protein
LDLPSKDFGMAGRPALRGEDLSGLWDGLYSYPRILAPASFVADLKETGGWLTGTTRETAASGSATGQNLSATLQGRRSGSSVKFLKLYDGSVPGFDSVAYEGNVSADGTEIDGRWTAIGNWSGTFLMIRSQGVAESRSKTAEERLGGAR